MMKLSDAQKSKLAKENGSSYLEKTFSFPR